MPTTNSVLWGNQAGGVPNEIYVSQSSVNVTYSDVQGGWPGTGNINADPRFVDPANGDVHLLYQSPCRHAGDNTATSLSSHDFEGDPRIAHGRVDMGADEFHPHLYCTGDFTPGGAIQAKFVGLPGTTPVGLRFGSGKLDPPVPTVLGDLCLAPPWAFVWLVPIPASGVLVLPVTIPGSLPTPHTVYLQALIGAQLSNLSVLEIQ